MHSLEENNGERCLYSRWDCFGTIPTLRPRLYQSPTTHLPQKALQRTEDDGVYGRIRVLSSGGLGRVLLVVVFGVGFHVMCYFYVAANGKYWLSYWPDDIGKSHVIPLLDGMSLALYDDQVNHRLSQIAIAAREDNLYLFVDGKYVNGVQDSHLTSGGQIGLTANKTLNDTEVVYSEVQLWLLPS